MMNFTILMRSIIIAVRFIKGPWRRSRRRDSVPGAGPNPCVLSGDLAAVYVKASLRPGAVEITARAEDLPARKIRILVRAPGKGR